MSLYVEHLYEADTQLFSMDGRQVIWSKLKWPPFYIKRHFVQSLTVLHYGELSHYALAAPDDWGTHGEDTTELHATGYHGNVKRVNDIHEMFAQRQVICMRPKFHGILRICRKQWFFSWFLDCLTFSQEPFNCSNAATSTIIATTTMTSCASNIVLCFLVCLFYLVHQIL